MVPRQRRHPVRLLAVSASAVGARVVANTIDATATLLGNGHVVRGTVLLGCTAGEQIRFTLTLTQGGASGTGVGAGVCTGELTAYAVTIPAGAGTFTPGVAQACATADNYDHGALVDSKQWCRASGVTLSDD